MKTIGAAVFFAALAFALTAPVWRAPSERIAGNIEHPGLRGELFHQWDFCRQAREGRLATHYYSNNVSWPGGQDLRRFIGFSLHLFFYLPLLWINDLVISYNLLVALTLALNGFAAFLLFRRVAGAYWPALVCGILFALSPYAFLKLEQGFLQKAILWWLPLFLLCLLRFLDNLKRRDAAMAGLFWLAALLTYAPYAWYAALAALVLLVFSIKNPTNSNKSQPNSQARNESKFRAMTLRAWPMFVPAIIGVLFLAWMLPGAGTQPPEGFIPVAVADAPIGSMDVLHLFRFLPYIGFRAQVAGLPLGLSISAILFAVLAPARKRPRSGFFFALALVFFVLAIGPFLSAGGKILTNQPMPFYAISLFAPWGKRLGYSIRALPFLELALLALAASGISGWRNNKNPAVELLLSLALLGTGVVEKAIFLPELFPPVITSTSIPADAAWLRDNAKIILHLPFNTRGDEPHDYCYITARSNTRMMNPYLDFRTEGFPLPPLPNSDPAVMADYLSNLLRAGATHIAVHVDRLALPPRRRPDLSGRDSPAENYTASDTEIFRNWCGAPAYENSGFLKVYAIPDMASIRRTLQSQRRLPAPFREEQLLASEARRLGLDRLPDIAQQTRAFEDRLIVERLIEQELRPRIRFSEKALREYYELHRSQFKRDPQMRICHLLLPLPQNPSSAEWAAAYARAESLFAEFAGPVDRVLELADALTRAESRGARWGDLGYMGSGRLPPVVDEELFSLREIGDIAFFESRQGFHLFRIMDIRPGRNFTFEEAREAVREQAEREALAREITRWAQTTLKHDSKIADDMARLPGGSFMMGSTPEELDRAVAMAGRFVGRTREVKREWFEDEIPRLVTVAPFELDRKEVTVAEFSYFLKATGRPPIPTWENNIPQPETLPVTGVTWDEAAAYAAWAGKRLPTAEEWEWAARGPHRRFFPWGESDPDGTRANYADKRLALPHNDPEHDDGFQGLAPVASFPAGATPEGVLDLAGNAREWTASQALGIIDPADHHIWAWESRPDNLRGDEIRPELMQVVKGGSFDSAADDLRCADMRMLPPNTRHESLGFRCARDITPNFMFEQQFHEKSSSAQ